MTDKVRSWFESESDQRIRRKRNERFKTTAEEEPNRNHQKLLKHDCTENTLAKQTQQYRIEQGSS